MPPTRTRPSAISSFGLLARAQAKFGKRPVQADARARGLVSGLCLAAVPFLLCHPNDRHRQMPRPALPSQPAAAPTSSFAGAQVSDPWPGYHATGLATDNWVDHLPWIEGNFRLKCRWLIPYVARMASIDGGKTVAHDAGST